MINASLYWVTPDAHWIWLGNLDYKGYGCVRDGNSVRKAHRVMYEQEKGIKLSPRKDLHHTCPYRSCINPAHVSYLSKTEHNRITHSTGNNLGNLNRAKTHCPRGHEYNTENTRTILNGKGRVCKVCKRQKARTQSLFKKFIAR